MKPFSQDDLRLIGAGVVLVVVCLVGASQSPALIWGALLFGVSVVSLLLRPYLDRWRLARRLRVEYDADTIRTCSREVVVAAIRWDELDEITVFTSEAGPIGDDSVWLFASPSRSKIILIAGTCPGFPALLEVLQQLADFDNVALLEAMGSTTPGRFVVWRRPRV
ncbi:MAG: hypothetical protein H7Z42_16840 [Roseiflexaceae bacterium]|nr:hypothetical protein [Roseiflexaceae bacterium]